MAECIRGIAPRAHLVVVPNVVDPNIFFPDPTRLELGAIRLISVARLSHQKGLDLLIRAVQLLQESGKDVQLTIVGDGPLMQPLRDLARQEDVRVRFTGFLPKENLAQKLREADVFVLPSRYETFCVAAAEALASGIPVVATRCGGPEDFVTDDVGRLVEVGSVKDFYRALLDVIERRESFDAQSLAAHAARRFSPNCVG